MRPSPTPPEQTERLHWIGTRMKNVESDPCQNTIVFTLVVGFYLSIQNLAEISVGVLCNPNIRQPKHQASRNSRNPSKKRKILFLHYFLLRKKNSRICRLHRRKGRRSQILSLWGNDPMVVWWSNHCVEMIRSSTHPSLTHVVHSISNSRSATADFIKKVLSVYTHSRTTIYLSLSAQVAKNTFFMKSPVAFMIFPIWLQSPSFKIELALARTSQLVPSSYNWDSTYVVVRLNWNIKAL